MEEGLNEILMSVPHCVSASASAGVSALTAAGIRYIAFDYVLANG